MAEPKGTHDGSPTPGAPQGAKISDVKKGVVTLDYVPPKTPPTPVRH